MRHRLPVVLQQRDFLLLWIALVAEAFGIQMIAVAVGLAGLLDQSLGVRPRPDRPLRVPAAAPARAPCRASRRPAPAPARLRDRARARRLRHGTPPRGHDCGRKAALALPRARGGQRRLRRDREPGGTRPRPLARSVRADPERDGVALDRVPVRNRCRPGARRPPLRPQRGVGLRVRRRHARDRRRSARRGKGARRAGAGNEGAGALERARGDQVHQANARHARCDLARSVRRSLRRCDRAAAALREADPPHGPARPRSAAQRARGRRAPRRVHARPQADPGEHRVDAPRRRRGVRGRR